MQRVGAGAGTVRRGGSPAGSKKPLMPAPQSIANPVDVLRINGVSAARRLA